VSSKIPEGVIPAVELALQHINDSTKILRGIPLDLVWNHTEVNTTSFHFIYFHYILQHIFVSYTSNHFHSSYMEMQTMTPFVTFFVRLSLSISQSVHLLFVSLIKSISSESFSSKSKEWKNKTSWSKQ
jgi:hypothetical protein